MSFEECDDDVKSFEQCGVSCFHLDTSAIAVRASKLLLNRMQEPEQTKEAEMESLMLAFVERTSVAVV